MMSKVIKKKYNTQHFYLEEDKRKKLVRYYETGINKKNTIDYRTYDQGIVIPYIKNKDSNNSYLGGVLDQDGNYARESQIRVDVGGGYYCSEVRYEDSVVVYCGSDFAHWGHFLVNVVPRLWIANYGNIKKEKYVIIREKDGNNTGLLKNEKIFLNYLGILDKVMIINRPTRFRTVIIPEVAYWGSGKFFYMGESIFHEFYLNTINFVKDKIIHLASKNLENKKLYPKVFLSRKEHGVLPIERSFEKNGYAIFYPEDISLETLVWVLNNAESIVSFCGTCQHNMLFAQNEANIIILERRIPFSAYQLDIDILKQLKTSYCNVQYSLFPSSKGMLTYTQNFNVFAQNQLESLVYGKEDIQSIIYDDILDCLGRQNRISGLGTGIIDDYWDSLKEDIDNIACCFPVIGRYFKDYYQDEEWWNKTLSSVLLELGICYKGWDESNEAVFERNLFKVIEKALDQGYKDFVIFPFGVNGLRVKRILKERYNILPKAIFDNTVSMYNTDILKSEKIKLYSADDTCMLLTANIPECTYIARNCFADESIFGWHTVV
jgi:hypothetical protein